MVFACATAQAADGIDITLAKIEASDEGYRLGANYSFDLNRDLEEALQHGVKLYFTTEIELTRPRWYWRDDRAVSSKRTVSISYDVLLRQYYVSTGGSVQQTFQTLDEAMFQIRRPGRWVIAPKSALKSGESYEVTLRMYMNRDLLQKPLQVNALSNSDWNLASNRKTFTYRAE
nr:MULTISPECIES: DUF4390 domain-containing protein [unclassified Massilia]